MAPKQTTSADRPLGHETEAETRRKHVPDLQENGFNDMMTRADFWALSTVAAIGAGIKTANAAAGCTVRGDGGEL